MRQLIFLGIVLSAGRLFAEPPRPPLEPLVRVVDLNIGESAELTLCDGSRAVVELVDVTEQRDDVCFAVRRADVTVRVNGRATQLVSATYNLPKTAAGVQIDCSITRGYNSNGRAESWGLEKDARIRLWPADAPLVAPGTFGYPVRQKWFATDTQMANVPVFVDGGDQPGERSIYSG